MTRAERLATLKAVWGPAPVEPLARSTWEFTMELLADLPERIAALVEEEGTDHRTLVDVFGSFLPRLQGEAVERLCCERKQEDVRDAVVEVLAEEPWRTMLYGRQPVQRTRIADRLAEEVADNLMRIVLMDPRYRWLL